MTNFQRLISYIYTYEGGIKGKNIGFAKLEVRGSQCRITVNVKKIFVGGNPIGVYMLTGREEIRIGTLFARNGSGEFRTVIHTQDLEHTGHSLDDCYGLSVHDVESNWRSYTTIWEDAVAHAAEVDLADVTAGKAARNASGNTQSESQNTPQSMPQSTSHNMSQDTSQKTDAVQVKAPSPEPRTAPLPISAEIERELKREELKQMGMPESEIHPKQTRTGNVVRLYGGGRSERLGILPELIPEPRIAKEEEEGAAAGISGFRENEHAAQYEDMNLEEKAHREESVTEAQGVRESVSGAQESPEGASGGQAVLQEVSEAGTVLENTSEAQAVREAVSGLQTAREAASEPGAAEEALEMPGIREAMEEMPGIREAVEEMPGLPEAMEEMPERLKRMCTNWCPRSSGRPPGLRRASGKACRMRPPSRRPRQTMERARMRHLPELRAGLLWGFWRNRILPWSQRLWFPRDRRLSGRPGLRWHREGSGGRSGIRFPCAPARRWSACRSRKQPRRCPRRPVRRRRSRKLPVRLRHSRVRLFPSGKGAIHRTNRKCGKC